MRHILVITLVLALSACANYAPRFDNVLYNHVVELTVMTKNAEAICNSPITIARSLPILNTKADVIVTYSKYRADQQDVNKAVSLYQSNIQEIFAVFERGETPTEGYCKGKMKIAQASLNVLLTAVGSENP